MWPLDVLHDPAWRPLTWTLLHFLWQGLIVASVWIVLFRLSRAYTTQFRYLLALTGMFVMAACPVATFVFLESRSVPDEATLSVAPALVRELPDMLNAVPLPTPSVGEVRNLPDVCPDVAPWSPDPVQWIGDAQPYLLCGWIMGLVFLSGRLLFGVVGAHRMGRGRVAVSGEIADRAAALAARFGFGAIPRVFSSRAACEAVVTGLLRPIVLLPVAWLAEMSPEVLDAVIAHELAHIRRFDLWFNLFQRFVETLLFYHPAVWWLSRRVRLAREMCCDELAAKATGERVVYATALELAARKRLEPTKSLLEVALGITRMTLLDRVRNVLGLAARHEQGRWWPAAVLTLLVPPGIWLASMAAVTSAQEKKPEAELKPVEKQAEPARGSEKPLVPVATPRAGVQPKHTATAFLRIAMEENPIMGGGAAPTNRDRFEIYKATHAELLKSRFIVRTALRNPKVAKVASIQRQQASGNAEDWLANRLRVSFPGNAEVMAVSLRGDDLKEAALLVNAVVDAYMTEVVFAEQDKKRHRFSELEAVINDKEQEMRTKREQLKSLTAGIGGSDPELLVMRQKLLLEDLAFYRNETAKSQVEVRRYEVELAVQKAFLEDAKGSDRIPILKEIKRLEVTIRVTTEQNAKLEANIHRIRKEVGQVGLTSVDVQMLRADIKNMDNVLAAFTNEREKLRVEIKTVPRVSLLERAE